MKYDVARFTIQFTVGEFYDWIDVVVRKFWASWGLIQCVQSGLDRGSLYSFYSLKNPVFKIQVTAESENRGELVITWIPQHEHFVKDFLSFIIDIPGVKINKEPTSSP